MNQLLIFESGTLPAVDISGSRALVTGGAHRVGKGIALALAGAGADLVLHYNRSAGPAEATARGGARARRVR